MKRKVRILIGNSQPALNDVLLDTVDWLGNGQYELIATNAERVEQILEYARSEEFDLCILILNNLHYPPEYHRPDSSPNAQWPEEFTDMASKFIAQLKQTFETPIIAMAGEPRDCVIWRKKPRALAQAISFCSHLTMMTSWRL